MCLQNGRAGISKGEIEELIEEDIPEEVQDLVPMKELFN